MVNSRLHKGGWKELFMTVNLSTFLKDHKGMVYYIGTVTGGGWVMIGTKTDIEVKEHKRARAEKFFEENEAEKRRQEIASLVLDNRLGMADIRIKWLLTSIKTNERVIKAFPRYSEWKNRLVLDSFPLLERNHIGIIVEGTEQGMYWSREEYQNESPMEDKEDE